MAQKTVTTLVDDLEPEFEGDETVEFGLDGVTYEIDLCDDNAAKLRGAFADFVAAARRTSGRAAGSRRGRAGRAAAPRANGSTSSSSGDRQRNKAIREWARGQGFEVSERGRIPDEAVQAYEAQHGQQPQPPRSASPEDVEGSGDGSQAPVHENDDHRALQEV